ncbi:bactofilin family protein [Chitinophaga nivalis]|uniref:Polymer-forming cytoskeletal protein n=1 Tax=Chitinophaga nivalis TaxID=2991709 RepID=A0ABT3ILH8_9BACT|nr:polymer-forming cytoskeletal protein [Chitinophaga nivalis]MCW3484796.1 polymer-forming cytoskeletal protein [Chitinophaga nivalis]
MINVSQFFRNIIAPGAFRIPKEVSVSGSIDATISGRIDGNVRGDVKTTGKLVISENASIRGHVYATDLVVYGKVYGDVHITNKAHISTKAYVKGDVNAIVLEIEEGAVIEGAIRKNVQPAGRSDHHPGETASATDPLHATATVAATPPPPPEEEQATSWF